MKNYYIDGVEFTRLMTVYSSACIEAKENDLPRPQMSNEAAAMLVLLATNLATKGNFCGYIFVEEMSGDAIENMLRYAHNFNPEKGAAFAYFTRIGLYAFYRRIALEKKMFRTKVKLVQEMPISQIMDSRHHHDTDEDYQNNYINYLIDFYNSNAVKEEEVKEREKKMKNKKPEPVVLSSLFK